MGLLMAFCEYTGKAGSGGGLVSFFKASAPRRRCAAASCVAALALAHPRLGEGERREGDEEREGGG